MDLSILIVTYNSRRLIDPLLTHLQQELAHLDAAVARKAGVSASKR